MDKPDARDFIDWDGIRAQGPAEAVRILGQLANLENNPFTAERVRIVGETVQEELARHKPGAQARAAKTLGLSPALLGRLYTKYKEKQTMTTTTEYGTWNNHGDRTAHTVEDTVTGYISGGDSEWLERIQADGSFEAMVAGYREAINDALPDGVSLNGNEFYGPYYDADQDWDGYPTNESGGLDIAAIIAEIDLGSIVDEHDPDSA
jgi:hypothetical protein